MAERGIVNDKGPQNDDQQLRRGTQRGISIRPDLAALGDRPPRQDKPHEFGKIRVKGLDARMKVALERNGYQVEEVLVRGEVKQLLVYNIELIKAAEELNSKTNGKVLRAVTPPGVKWNDTSKSYLAYPDLWSDALTATVNFTMVEGDGVKFETVDRRRSGGKKEGKVLSKGKIYRVETWGKAESEASGLAAGLGAPAGSPAGLSGSNGPAQTFFDDNGYGTFQSSGLYSSAPGTRYGFMGWSRPKAA